MARSKTGFPFGLTEAFIFSFNKRLPSSVSPALYKVAIVPTKTSLAANDVINAIPIFQSYPRGEMTGSMDLPRIPA